MTGEYQHALDNKGRIFIPARLRDELGQVLFVTLSMDRCLSVYSAASWEVLNEKVNALCSPMRSAVSWTPRGGFSFPRTFGTGRAFGKT